MTLKYPIQGHPETKYITPIKSPLMLSYMTFLSPTLYLSSHSRYLMRKSC